MCGVRPSVIVESYPSTDRSFLSMTLCPSDVAPRTSNNIWQLTRQERPHIGTLVIATFARKPALILITPGVDPLFFHRMDKLYWPKLRIASPKSDKLAVLARRSERRI